MPRFDGILNGRIFDAAPWDQVLAENSGFVTFPSIGALVPGWMLVVPRRRVLSLRELSSAEWESLTELAREVSKAQEAFPGEVFELPPGTDPPLPGEVFMFEHGNTVEGGPVGCGVDHAHLHLVPLAFDLLAEARAGSDAEVEWLECQSSEFSSLIPASGEYLAIWRPRDGAGLVGSFRNPQSQWIRRVIAAKLGKGDAWDYKAHPGMENLHQTVTVMSTNFRRNSPSRPLS